MSEKPDSRMAVLIDADNVSCSYAKPMLEELARYGTPTVKRIYGDWTSPNLSNWKAILLENAIIPVQQYSYTTGKNSTDSALIIDAMDLLYTGNLDCFCIVSSDSDFTRLATRLREAGKKVIGIGEEKTPKPFIAACDKFIFLEILKPNVCKPVKIEKAPAKSTGRGQSQSKLSPEPLPQELINLLVTSVEDIAGEDGWTFLGDLGNLILKKNPSFDPRNYGYTKLTPLILATDMFDIDVRETSNKTVKHMYVRLKQSEG
ncbi:MAG: NYN domain-containing protein [Clostridiales bacterium]|jgi:uncharacterized protein (TIGR00288 family)|nr:NYN domain-containing protein [Clostridiales bacterium]HOA33805.1 NYN domain-containing protein [Clostridiales bacterium]HOJ35073.1 NYN domain-containing protein [Clostridiales bacterium]HOL79987.1 NYN domain-containing protein [Clostridiales bacterium]HPP68033.1 NYN domain-containing protein [Clostridiales bacterium]